MDEGTQSGVAAQTSGWRNTREAAENFRRMLLCSKCSDLMKEPVCLGTCEHLLCRSCAGRRVGGGCAVCRSPAWVKDVQVNRPLSSIVEVFCTLESLLTPGGEEEGEDSSLPDSHTPTESHVFRQKKNVKIWFSPRSRKVRCTVEKPTELHTGAEGGSEAAAAHTHSAAAAQSKDLTVFNFSSQDSASSCSEGRRAESQSRKKRSNPKKAAPARRGPAAARKQVQRKVTKNLLEALNQQWGIMEEAAAPAREGPPPPADVAGKTSKRVSFQSPAEASEELQGGAAVENQTQLCRETPQRVAAVETPSTDETDNPENTDGEGTPKSASKRPRTEAEVVALETTPKRPRASPGRGRRSPGRIPPSVLNPPPPGGPTGQRSSGTPRKEQGRGTPRKEQGRSPPAPRKSPSTPSSGSASPSVGKKNHKGETALHLAAIKGDVAAVEGLLEQGADPNLKDHAGWTPLHEACNLGHLAVVELLLSRGALLNTPGYQNDSPLHDAVRNGRTAVASLLLQLGASQNVLNLSGKRPADYAVGPEMLQIFRKASEGARNVNASPSPSAGLPAASECVRRDVAVLLCSGLSRAKRQRLNKLGRLLEARTADTFSGSVSHILVPDGAMPTTSSALLGLLAGCWVVKYSWVEACLQAGRWMPESQHEAGGGPQRSRANRCSLLPRLLDGCFFFLLGSFTAPSREELHALLLAAGGQLLSRQPKPDSDVTQTLSAAAYHAAPESDQALCTQYILYDPRGPHRPAAVRRGKVWSAPSSWLLDCIAAFRLLPVPNPQT